MSLVRCMARPGDWKFPNPHQPGWKHAKSSTLVNLVVLSSLPRSVKVLSLLQKIVLLALFGVVPGLFLTSFDQF